MFFGDQLASKYELQLPDGFWLVVDMNARPDTTDISTGAKIIGTRIHEIPYGGQTRPIPFKANEAVAMPEDLAIKFLGAENFARVNTDGIRVDWKNPPRQPDQLQAGEQFRLADNETVADYEELTAEALRVRAIREKGGEQLKNANKATLIEFLMQVIPEKRRKNTGQEPAGDFFDPEPEPDASGMDGMFQE